MIADSEKNQIYEVLKGKFGLGSSFSLSDAGRELALSGHGCRKYGYARMKDMMSDFPEFAELSEKPGKNGTTLCTVVLHEYHPEKKDEKDEEPDPSPEPEKTEPEDEAEVSSLELAEDENELASGLHIHASAEKKPVTQETFASKAQADGEPVYVPPKFAPKRIKVSAEEQGPVRSSSGSVRFSGPSTGSTFREDGTARRTPVRSLKTTQEGTSTFDRMVYMPPKVVDFLVHKGMTDPGKVLSESYQKSVENHSFVQRGVTITFPVEWEKGSPGMIAILKKNEKPYGRHWFLTYCGYPKVEQETEKAEEKEEFEDDRPIAPGQALEQFADMGYWQEFLHDLADIALPENWELSNKRLGKYYVLKKYIQYTFYRLQQENKVCISDDHQFAAFNTGLVNTHYDDIYACFVPNDSKETKQEWKFEAFALAGIRGKDGYGKMLTSYFDPLPQVPTYVKNNVDLIYDLNKDLITDYEHIIIENLRRLPLGYLKECCYGDEKSQEMLEAIERARDSSALKQAYFAFSKYIEENDKIYRRLRNRMEDAIEMALKRVRWNFRTAIPCYFPKGNCMSLMLPLCLEDDTHTDAALVVIKNPSGSYQGQTVLQLDQAYLDARLICRPNPDWLQQGQSEDFFEY